MSGDKVAVYVEPHVSLPYVLNLAARNGAVVSANDMSATGSHRVVFVARDVAAKLCDTDSRLFSVPVMEVESVRDVAVAEGSSTSRGVTSGSNRFSSRSSARLSRRESDSENKEVISSDRAVKKASHKPVKKAATKPVKQDADKPVKQDATKPVKKTARKKTKKANAAKRKTRGDDRGES